MSEVPVAVDLVKRLDEVIESFDALTGKSDEQSAKKFVMIVYDKMQMTLFSENYLQSNLLAIVSAETNAMMRGVIKGKDSLEGEIMTITEKMSYYEFFERLGLPKGDVQKVKTDLSNALNISKTTLESLAELVGNPLEDQISRVRVLAQGGTWNASAIRADSRRRSLRDGAGIRGSALQNKYQDSYSLSLMDWVLARPAIAALQRTFDSPKYPMPIGDDVGGYTDDEYSSHRTVWGSLCAQTYMLPNRERFVKICSGSSYGIEDAQNLGEHDQGEVNLLYDRWWNNRKSNTKTRDGWNGEDPVCTTYDLRRRWQIYYTTQQIW